MTPPLKSFLVVKSSIKSRLNKRQALEATKNKFTNFPKKLKTKTSMNINKKVDFGGAMQKQMSPSNSTRKTTHIDLFSSLCD